MSEPVIQFSESDGFGTFTGWDLISDTPTLQKDRARAIGSKGNGVASKLHNERTEYTAVYVCKNDTNTVPATIGALVNSRILTSIQFDTANADEGNKMTLVGHNHADNAHADTLRQVAHGITCPKAFGVVDFLGGTAGDAAGLQTGTCTIACQHNDKQDGDGDHLVGNNYDATITASTTWAGTPSVTAAAGWDVTTKADPVSNTEFKSCQVDGTKDLTLADPA